MFRLCLFVLPPLSVIAVDSKSQGGNEFILEEFQASLKTKIPTKRISKSRVNMMCQQLETVRQFFDAQYAPWVWKEESDRWNLQKEVRRAQIQLLENPNLTLKEYHRALRQCLATAHDYHVSVSFFSTEFAFLPFRVESVEKKYFVVEIHPTHFTPEMKEIEVGDELITFDGKPVEEAVLELIKERGCTRQTPTEQVLAEAALTWRSGKRGDSVPQGPISFEIRKKKSGVLIPYHVEWNYFPEKIESAFLYKEEPLPSASAVPLSFLEMMVPFFWSDLKDALPLVKEKEGDFLFIGTKKGFLPPLGKIVWQNASSLPFYAYLFETPQGKRVGYLRIPHYQGGEYEASQFAALISFFEKEAKLLIIDELNNPGGHVLHMYALASMLSPEPIKVPLFQKALTQEDIFLAFQSIEVLEKIKSDDEARQALGLTLYGYPVNLTFVTATLQYLRQLIQEWNEGNHISTPQPLFGIAAIAPHPNTHFTKPIVLLMNHLSFSCADFLPAILKDNKRALLVGTTTAGAGGCVSHINYPNLFAVDTLSLTNSIAITSTQNPIEDCGVKPDVEIRATQKDLQQGHVDYAEAVLKIVEGLL